MFRFIYILFFIVSFSFPKLCFAQKFVIEATFKLKQPDNNPLVGATLSIYDNNTNSTIISKLSDNNGAVFYKLDATNGIEYRIEISKGGYISKKMIIDTKIPNVETLPGGTFTVKYVINLGKGETNANIKPYRKIKYFTNIKDFDDDPTYKPESTSLATNTNTQNVTTPPKGNDTKYVDAIKKGNDLLAQNKLSEAKLAFNEALIAKPGDKMAKDKIAEVENKIKLAEKVKANEDKTKLDAEAKRKAEEKAKAEAAANQRKYDNALAQGNKLMAAKQFELAKDQFQNALIAKPDDKVALQKINDATRELAKDDELKRRQFKVMETLNLANTLLKQNKLPESKLKFQEVLAIDPGNKDAGQKLKEIEVRQANMQNSKNDSKKIAELIARGDKDVAKENYPEAIAQYNEALKLSPNDKTITTKINNANKNLNNKKDKLYARAVSNGDQAMLGKDYEIAKLEYEKALALKPSDKYPKSQLKEVNRILLEMSKTLEEISKLSKEKASTADIEYLKDKQLKQEKLKVIKKEQEYLERKMKNLSTKYDTENPITKLYNVVDLSEKNKK